MKRFVFLLAIFVMAIFVMPVAASDMSRDGPETVFSTTHDQADAPLVVATFEVDPTEALILVACNKEWPDEVVAITDRHDGNGGILLMRDT